MAVKLRDLAGFASGLLTDRGPAYAAGAGVAASNGVIRFRDKLRGVLGGLGRKVGAVAGAAIPAEIARGAAAVRGPTAADAERRFLGVSLGQVGIYGLLGAIGILIGGGYLLWRLARR